jgi:sterol desaturase/sphingolipid hydroxylase (fatty acid hydroxylase superfamily)
MHQSPVLEFFCLTFLKSLAAFTVVALLLYWIFPKFWPQAFDRSPPLQWRRELALSVFNLLLWSSASTLIVVTAYYYDVPKIPDLVARAEQPAIKWIYFPLWFVFMLLMVDTMFYWTHRLLHHPRVFRWAHHTHHRFYEPSAFSGYSFHLVEGVLLSLFTVSLPYMILPFTFATCWLFNLFAIIWAVVLHAGWRTREWSFHPLLTFINSPSHHRAHHQSGEHNFGLYFSFWDKALGTEKKT